MNKIVIESPERAILAGTWAEENIKGQWNLALTDPFSNCYYFTFSDPRDATMFSLKWR
jgi:hypothetical protein